VTLPSAGDACAFEVRERLCLVALAHDELLHAVFRALRIERDEGDDAGLLDVGIRRIDREDDGDRVDLTCDHAADRKRRHRDALHLGLDPGILEVAAIDGDEIGQRRGDRVHRHRDLVERERRNGSAKQHQRANRASDFRMHYQPLRWPHDGRGGADRSKFRALGISPGPLSGIHDPCAIEESD